MIIKKKKERQIIDKTERKATRNRKLKEMSQILLSHLCAKEKKRKKRKIKARVSDLSIITVRKVDEMVNNSK